LGLSIPVCVVIFFLQRGELRAGQPLRRNEGYHQLAGGESDGQPQDVSGHRRQLQIVRAPCFARFAFSCSFLFAYLFLSKLSLENKSTHEMEERFKKMSRLREEALHQAESIKADMEQIIFSAKLMQQSFKQYVSLSLSLSLSRSLARSLSFPLPLSLNFQSTLGSWIGALLAARSVSNATSSMCVALSLSPFLSPRMLIGLLFPLPVFLFLFPSQDGCYAKTS
jgi:hypothetical protein